MKLVGFIGRDNTPVICDMNVKMLDLCACAGLPLLYEAEPRSITSVPVDVRMAYDQLAEANMLDAINGKTAEKVCAAVHALVEKTGGRHE